MLDLAPAAAERAWFAALRAREFARLDEQGEAYLDYGGSALYGQSQIRAHAALLQSGLFGNPHSESTASRASTECIDQARRRVLRFFDVDESTHAVIFTANATAAIKLVAESYPFSERTACVLAADNHNSVNGIREYAARAGAGVRTLPLDDELRLRDPLPLLAEAGGGLLAFPAQSNFSGVLHPLRLVADAQALGYDVLLDAAAYAPSHALSLRDVPADLTVLSFYKLFGYPTGVGALIARREALARLHRPWFAGGTVLYASVAAPAHRLRPGHEGFEDGTANFLGIAALPAGFDLLEQVSMARVTARVENLAARLIDGLSEMRHVRMYGPRDLDHRGGTVAFNVDGVPCWEVEARARETAVSLRGGCFCNPGASEAAFRLRASEIEACLSAMGESFTPARFAECAGKAVGAVRLSIGLANNEADIDRALEVVSSFA